MNPLLSPNLSNALTDNVIDAAKSAGLNVPGTIDLLHSQRGARRGNRWHLAMGADNRDYQVPASERRHAVTDLTKLTEWAVALRDSDAVQTRLEQAKQPTGQTTSPAEAARLVEQAVVVDDALKTDILEHVYEEPELAQSKMKRFVKDEGGPAALIAQLERTPEVFGEMLGARRFSSKTGTRHTALETIRTKIVGPIREAIGEPASPQSRRPMEVARPTARGLANQHLMAFERAVTQLAATHAALMASDVQQDIALNGVPAARMGGPASSRPAPGSRGA